MIIFRMLLFPVVFFIAYTAAVFGLAGPEFWESIYSPIADWLLTISIFFLYYFAFEVIWQRTPGKFITRTKVVTPDGRKPATYAIAVRTLARLVPFEPLSFLGKEAYGWHDKWSCTTIVRAKRIEQNLTETSLTTNQDEQSLEITALLEKEYGNERPEKETVAQAKAVTENCDQEKQGVVADQIGTVKVACREEEICDAVTHGQSTETDEEHYKWFLVGFLVLILIAIIAVRFSNTPAATRADIVKADAYCIRGAHYAGKVQYDLAISEFTKAIEINPRFAGAYYNRGFAYAKKGQYDFAISDINKAIEINPMYAEAYCIRGIAYSGKDKYDLAISDYNKALEINPRDAFAYNNRGIAYAKKGEYVLSISDYTKAIEINPRLAQVYSNRGNAHLKRGCQYNLAILDYTRALEINPRDAEVYNNRGIAYAKKGEYDKALEDIHKAESLGYQVDPELLKLLRH